MKSDKYPGWQRMISFDSVDVVLARHRQILEYRSATDEDCRIERMEAITERNGSLAYRQGFRSQHELHWTTGKGWQVYMQHTGCHVPNPDEMVSTVSTGED